MRTIVAGLNDQVDFFQLIQQIIQNQNPQQALQTIVSNIKIHMMADVCSLYGFFNQELVLCATEGLNPDSIGKIRMKPGQGLTGEVFQKKTVVNVKDVSKDKRNLIFADAQEDPYYSYLGIPLTLQNETIGVLTLQTREPRIFSPIEISVITTILQQISPLLARLVGQKFSSKKDSYSHDILSGQILSAGFGKGMPLFPEIYDVHNFIPVTSTDIAAEIQRYRQAHRQISHDLETAAANQKKILGEDLSTIFDAHRLMLADRAFHQKNIQRIEAGLTVESAIALTANSLIQTLEKSQNSLFTEKTTDIRDLASRLLLYLSADFSGHKDTGEDFILIVNELLPSQIFFLDLNRLKGIVVENGSPTSHAVILATALNLPVLKISGAHNKVPDGRILYLDAHSGLLYCDPPANIRQTLEDQHVTVSQEYHPVSAFTKNKKEILIGANLGMLAEIPNIKKSGAQFIGLYRTEFPFMIRRQWPTVEEQTELYKKVLTKTGIPVTFRTLDIGYDKQLPYLDHPKEQNPALGWRGIRMSLSHPDIFCGQIEAILLACKAVSKNEQAKEIGKILLPMITHKEELDICLELIQGCEKKTHFKLPVGIMVETPAIALSLETVLQDISFLNIGTNDLVQFLLAADRDNPRLTSCYQYNHPAIRQILNNIIQKAGLANKPVYACGEMAGDPAGLEILLECGVKALSIPSLKIPEIRKKITGIVVN